MQRNIIVTKDGSPTIRVPDWGVAYHSVHGAIQESMHVFIDAGWNEACRIHAEGPVWVFEMGFGTGLNALLTLIESGKTKRSIFYETIDLNPLLPSETTSLDYAVRLERPDLEQAWEQMHLGEYDKPTHVSENFVFEKHQQDLRDFHAGQPYHLIYYDAFAPSAQPELWTLAIFEKLYAMLMPDGILVTYCAKGAVRRAMQAAGFLVEKLQGPPGKREMLRARRAS